MPEELVVILVIVIGVIWLLVKIGQGIVAFIDQSMKNHNAAAAKRALDRFSRDRDSLRQYVYSVIPNELDDFQRKFERMRTEFEGTQRLTEWVARPPAWKKLEFQLVVPQNKDASYRGCVLMRLTQY